MKISVFTFVFILSLSSFAIAQQPLPNGQITAITNFFDGYNKHDYKKMRSSFHWIMKLVLSEWKTKEMFGAQNAMDGNASVLSIKNITASKVSVELVYSGDTTVRENMGFEFTKKNKIIGFSHQSVKLLYPKSNTNSASDNSIKHSIDSLVQLKNKGGHFNGCVLAANNGKVIYKNCTGYSNYENKTPLNDSSMFELASCSKQFTAMAIMMLAEQGKLKYTDTIQKYILGLPYKNITIENLLTHTSGIPDYFEMLDKHWDKTKYASNYDIVTCFQKYKPKILFKPGKKYEYSNTGYAMLSVIIEKVSGMTYGDYLSKNIFEPLHMKNTRVYNTRRTKHESINNYAYGYVYSDSLKKHVLPDILPNYDFVIYMDAITGDGDVNSTISDLYLWDKGLRENKLVLKSTLDKAFTKAKLKSGEEINYGNGWELQCDGKFENIAYHSGAWPGYHTFILHFIDKEKTIIILSNNEYQNMSEFVNKAALILEGQK